MKKLIFVLVLLSTNVLFADNPLRDAVYTGDLLLLDELIEASQLINFTPSELRILRNMIYAKYNYRFNDIELQDYFNRFSWYNGTENNVENRLTNIDHRNVYTIQILEERYPVFRSYYDESVYDLFDVLHWNGGLRIMGWSDDGKLFFAGIDSRIVPHFGIYDLKENKTIWRETIKFDYDYNLVRYKENIDTMLAYVESEFNITPINGYTLTDIEGYSIYSKEITERLFDSYTNKYWYNEIGFEIGLKNDVTTKKLGEIIYYYRAYNDLSYLCVKSPFEDNIIVLVVIVPAGIGGDQDRGFIYHQFFGIDLNELYE